MEGKRESNKIAMNSLQKKTSTPTRVQLWLRVTVAKLSHIVCNVRIECIQKGKELHLATIGLDRGEEATKY